MTGTFTISSALTTAILAAVIELNAPGGLVAFLEQVAG